MVSFLGSLMTYFATYQVIQQEIVNSNSVMLETLQISTDNRLSRAQELSNSLIRDQRFLDFLRKGNSPEQMISAQTELVTLLRNYCDSSDASILIYLPDLDYCVTNGTANTLPRLYNALYYSTDMALSLPDWREYLANID